MPQLLLKSKEGGIRQDAPVVLIIFFHEVKFMDKSTKIIAGLLVAIVAVFVVVVVITTSAMKKDDEPETTAAAAPTVSVAPDVTTTPTTTETTVPPTPLSELILGQWTDSANMSGYAFYADGTVEMTYVNLTVPVINIPINGVSKGVYTLDGDKLTTKFSIYSATIENSYTVKVENNSLSMKSHEDGETATYQKAAAAATTVPANTDEATQVDEIVGSWVNDNSTVRYAFNDDGTLKVTFSDARLASVSTEVLNGEYTGVYLTDGSSIIIQFTVNGQKITQRCDFSVSKNTLSLTDDTGNTDLYVREGTSIVTPGSGSLVGKWADSTGMSGYEFKEGGVVVITYVNFTVPVVNIPINGSFTGSYSISGNKITVSYSIYGNSMVDTFEYAVNGNTLTLKADDGNVSTYIKK